MHDDDDDNYTAVLWTMFVLVFIRDDLLILKGVNQIVNVKIPGVYKVPHSPPLGGGGGEVYQIFEEDF